MDCKHQGPTIGKLKIACTNAKSGEREVTVYTCALFGRCINSWTGPWNEEQQNVEGKLYTLCRLKDHNCPEYKAVDS